MDLWIEPKSVQMCVTSPPYFGLRDYGVDGQLGLEETPEQFIAALVEVFRCVRDVLDPFMGSGTTAQVALQHGRRAIGCELNSEYIDLIHQRLAACGTVIEL